MSMLLGLRGAIYLAVKNATASDIAPHSPVDLIAGAGMLTSDVGGGSETIAGTWDPASPAEPVMHVEAAVDGGTDFIGVTPKGIKAGEIGEVIVWGPAQAYVSNNTKPVAIGEAICVAGANWFDDDTTINCGRAMEVGADNDGAGTTLSWIFVNAIGRHALGGN